MSKALAFALLLIHQHQARDFSQQYRLQQLFAAFIAGALTAEQYERDLHLARDLPWRAR